MASPTTSITKDRESYRRGVIFGLTMAEVLLLLVFCILLFLKLINDKLNEEKENLELANEKLNEREKTITELILKNEKQASDLAKLRGVIAATPEAARNSKFITKIVESAIVLETIDPEKASEILVALQDNPDLLEQVQLSTIDEWEELTTIAQYSVSKDEYAVLSNLTEIQKSNFFSNAEIAANNTEEELIKLIADASKANETTPPTDEGNNWPPIISLSEALDYSFNVGSATLAPQFQTALTGTIADDILKILQDYDADVIEVIGHTDTQPMRDDRITNLDDNSVNFLNSKRNVTLRAKDNAGLGYARALSVTKELMKVPSLRDYTILPYSAAQMITPDEELQTGSSEFDAKQLRRIEIRVRRKQ